MERLFIDIDNVYYKIVGFSYDTVDDSYKIKYKCKACGEYKYTIIKREKVCIFRCKCHSKLMYITPIFSNRTTSGLVGYNSFSDSLYRKVRSLYKEIEREESLCSYINNYIRDKGKLKG